MMGYVTIDSIGVEIPIYHGTSDKVLAFAAGHMQGTSIPIGVESTHSVLSAHRGLPNARLFTDLPKVQVGDSFTVTILDRVMIYQVDQILTVLPENTTEINVVEGQDYCTLITCTPYGINSHRLLVRGTRVETLSTKQRYVGDEAYRIDELVVTPIVALPIIFILLIIVALQPVKQIQIMDNDMYDDDDEDEEKPGEGSETEK
jgi:sortase A